MWRRAFCIWYYNSLILSEFHDGVRKSTWEIAGSTWGNVGSTWDNVGSTWGIVGCTWAVTSSTLGHLFLRHGGCMAGTWRRHGGGMVGTPQVLSRACIRRMQPRVWRHPTSNNYPGKENPPKNMLRKLSGITFSCTLILVCSRNACKWTCAIKTNAKSHTIITHCSKSFQKSRIAMVSKSFFAFHWFPNDPKGWQIVLLHIIGWKTKKL